jgi:hypothetical protein
MGVAVKDSSANPQKKAEDAEMQRFLMVANTMLDKEDSGAPDEGRQMVESMVETQEGEPAEEEMPQEEMVQEEKPQGLMARG